VNQAPYPFFYNVNYSTIKMVDLEGNPEIKEKFELRKPDYHLEA